MREDIAGPQGASSRPMWETLEGMVREKAQEFIQQIMRASGSVCRWLLCGCTPATGAAMPLRSLRP